MSVSVPPSRNAGDSGHITDHNQISSDLTTISTSVDDLNARLPAGKITVSGTEPSSPVDNDAWLDTSGIDVGGLISTTGQPHYVGPDFPTGAADGATWVQTCPGNSLTPTVTDAFESNDTSHWDNVTAVTVNRTSARFGLYGAQQAPSASVSTMSWSPSRVPQNHTWCAFEHWFRIDQMPPVGTSAAILTIQNLGQVDNFDFYVNNSGYLGTDLKSADSMIVDTKPVVGSYHSIEGRLFYGAATYQLILRYDGKLLSTLTSNGTPGSSFVRSLTLGSSSTQTYQISRDYTAIYTADSDPGFITPRVPVVRQRVSGVWL